MYFKANEYLEDSGDVPVCLVLTNVDLKLFLEQYEVDIINWDCGWKFRSMQGLFTKYIDKNSIFMRKDIRDGFDVMYKEMKMVSYKYREYIRTKIEKASDIYIELHNLLKKITELKEEAELEIQKIVFPEKISR